ncbi:MAG: hypothetical protein MUC42_08645, partial [Bryobacter sp.]|nr:hypothetical protein [Bryobacter sp.]
MNWPPLKAMRYGAVGASLVLGGMSALSAAAGVRGEDPGRTRLAIGLLTLSLVMGFAIGSWWLLGRPMEGLRTRSRRIAAALLCLVAPFLGMEMVYLIAAQLPILLPPRPARWALAGLFVFI